MSFIYNRIVRFQDTDAAGVVYFANLFSICHEAYETSLAASGINLKSFFTQPTLAIPIVNAQANFLHPLFCGDELSINLTPQQLNESKFEINYTVSASSSQQHLATAVTQHVCIELPTRTKMPLPTPLLQWLYRWRGDSVGNNSLSHLP